MRLLLLLPVTMLMAIAGYNLTQEVAAPHKFYFPIALHLVVALISLLFLGLIIKSMFKVKYIQN